MDIAADDTSQRRRASIDAFDGIDLTAHLTRQAPVPDRTVFWEYKAQTGARRRQVETGDRSERRSGKGDHPGTMLFDIMADPSEKNNLAPTQPVIVQKLTEQAAAWKARGYKVARL